MKFLYWNVNRKPIKELIIALANEHDIDIIILSECTFSISEFLFDINNKVKTNYGLPYSPVTDPIIITRLPRRCIKIIEDSQGVSVRRLFPIIGPDILLITVHLRSKLYQTEDDQLFYSTRLARLVESQEEKAGHRRTIIVGDLNMNPFEHGVVGSDGLHGVMKRNIAEKKSRIVGGEERFFFYNPMWRHFGENSFGPSGTYYYNTSTQINYYWNIFDQVLVRAELLEYFSDDDLHILTSAGSTNLLNSLGRPDSDVASDHLPIIFSLELMKGVENVS